MGYGLDASCAMFDRVMVLGYPMLFTCCRVDRDTVPGGVFVYEVRHADDDWGDPVQISDYVQVNHYGTLLTNSPIRLEYNPKINRSYLKIDPDKDWDYESRMMTVKQYMERYSPKKEKPKIRER